MGEKQPGGTGTGTKRKRQWWLLSPGFVEFETEVLGQLCGLNSSMKWNFEGIAWVQNKKPLLFFTDGKPMANLKVRNRNSWGYCFLVYSLMFVINYRTEYLCTHCYILL